MADLFNLIPGVGDSPEHIAFRLFEVILQQEAGKTSIPIDRRWILNTYAECLVAVRNPPKPPMKIDPGAASTRSRPR
jgi:hypothetical protein